MYCAEELQLSKTESFANIRPHIAGARASAQVSNLAPISTKSKHSDILWLGLSKTLELPNYYT